MTKYELEDFENWLGKASSSGMTKEHWEQLFRMIQRKPWVLKVNNRKGIDMKIWFYLKR